MSFRDEALAANRAYGASPPPIDADDARPAREVVVVTCMDARLRPEDATGLRLGDAHVLRNAGGRVTDDVRRSLMLSSSVLGTREAVVIHHTGCGLLGATNGSLRRAVTERTGVSVPDVDFLPFDDEDLALLEDVAEIENDPRLPFELVSGFLYDVRTGRLREVAAPPS